MELFIFCLVLFVMIIFIKKPTDQRSQEMSTRKSQDSIIPIFFEPESGKKDCLDGNSSLGFEYEDYDLYDDFGG